MAKDKKGDKKKAEIVLTKENLLVQPLALTLLSYNPSVIGNRTIIAIVRKLQGAFKEMISDRKKGKEWKQLSLFATEEVKEKFLGNTKLVFDLHLKEIVSDAKHYQDAFNSLYSLGDIMVWVPFPKEGGGFYMNRVPLYTIIVEMEPEKVKKKVPLKKLDADGNKQFKEVTAFRYPKGMKPIVGIVIERVVADYIFNFQERYGDYLDYTALIANDKYFAPIYIWLSAYKYNTDGYVDIDYWEFRKKLGFDDSDKEHIEYSTFADFNKFVLKPSSEEMKRMSETGESDIFFEYEKIYFGSKRAKYPDKIRFRIILSELGKKIKENKAGTKLTMEIEKRLVREFDQTPIQVREIIKKTPLSLHIELIAKMNRLTEDIQSGKVKIKESLRAYANKSLKDFVEGLRVEEQKVEDVVSDKKMNEEAKHKPEIENPVAALISAEDEERWNKFLSLVKKNIPDSAFKTWFNRDTLKFKSYKRSDDGKLVLAISVPSIFYYEYLEANYVKVMRDALSNAFSPECMLYYNVEKI